MITHSLSPYFSHSLSLPLSLSLSVSLCENLCQFVVLKLNATRSFAHAQPNRSVIKITKMSNRKPETVTAALPDQRCACFSAFWSVGAGGVVCCILYFIIFFWEIISFWFISCVSSLNNNDNNLPRC